MAFALTLIMITKMTASISLTITDAILHYRFRNTFTGIFMFDPRCGTVKWLGQVIIICILHMKKLRLSNIK